MRFRANDTRRLAQVCCIRRDGALPFSTFGCTCSSIDSAGLGEGVLSDRFVRQPLSHVHSRKRFELSLTPFLEPLLSSAK